MHSGLTASGDHEKQLEGREKQREEEPLPTPTLQLANDIPEPTFDNKKTHKLWTKWMNMCKKLVEVATPRRLVGFSSFSRVFSLFTHCVKNYMAAPPSPGRNKEASPKPSFFRFRRKIESSHGLPSSSNDSSLLVQLSPTGPSQASPSQVRALYAGLSQSSSSYAGALYAGPSQSSSSYAAPSYAGASHAGPSYGSQLTNLSGDSQYTDGLFSGIMKQGIADAEAVAAAVAALWVRSLWPWILLEFWSH